MTTIKYVFGQTPIPPIDQLNAVELLVQPLVNPLFFRLTLDFLGALDSLSTYVMYVMRHDVGSLSGGLAFGLIHLPFVHVGTVATEPEPFFVVWPSGRVRFILRGARDHKLALREIIRQLPLIAGDSLHIRQKALYWRQDRLNHRLIFGYEFLPLSTWHETWLLSKQDSSDLPAALFSVQFDGTRLERLNLGLPLESMSLPEGLPAIGSRWQSPDGKCWRIGVIEYSTLNQAPYYALIVHDDKGLVKRRAEEDRDYALIANSRLLAQFSLTEPVSQLLWAGLSTDWVQLPDLPARTVYTLGPVTNP